MKPFSYRHHGGERVLASPPPLENTLGVDHPRDPGDEAPSPLPPALQVFPACRPPPDPVDVHSPSCASSLCPWPLAPVRSALLPCPQGLDLYICTLQMAPPGTAPQDLREDSMSTSKPRAQGCTLVEAEGGGTVRFGDGRGRGPIVTGEDRASGTLD